MFPIIGIVVVLSAIFGVYLIEGGSFEVLAEAAPMEFLMIFGSACGALSTRGLGGTARQADLMEATAFMQANAL